MRIACPYCGDRDLREFTYLGDATVTRPEIAVAPDQMHAGAGESSGQAAMFDYVYMRDNPAGLHHEYWYHGAGCRQWLIVARDTTTHEISGVWAANGYTLLKTAGLAKKASGKKAKKATAKKAGAKKMKGRSRDA